MMPSSWLVLQLWCLLCRCSRVLVSFLEAMLVQLFQQPYGSVREGASVRCRVGQASATAVAVDIPMVRRRIGWVARPYPGLSFIAIRLTCQTPMSSSFLV